MVRISFSNKSICLEFFNEVRKALGIKTWRELASFLGTSKSMIDGYRNKKLCLPEERFNILLNKLSINKQNYFSEFIEKKDNNWGRILGGKVAYKINKEKFNQGRKKGALNRKDAVKYDFNINLPLSQELCEFIGVIIGDGFTNKYGSRYQTQITGDKNLDRDYYFKNLKSLCESLFKIIPKIDIREDSIRLNIYSKRLFEMLTQRFKIPAGIKCYSVEIPSEILMAGSPFLNSTLKGMFNTDGGVGLDRRKTYKKPYIRINYTSASPKLIEQLHIFLLNFNIPHSINKRNNTQLVQINGEENVKRFIKYIGFSNPRSLNKISYLTS